MKDVRGPVGDVVDGDDVSDPVGSDVKPFIAHCTGEWLFVGVNQHVSAKFAFGGKTLLTMRTRELGLAIQYIAKNLK